MEDFLSRAMDKRRSDVGGRGPARRGASPLDNLSGIQHVAADTNERIRMNTKLRPLILSALVALPVLGRANDETNKVLVPYAQDLVGLRGDRLVHFKPDKFLTAPYTVLYFAAGWCPDCRRFSPALVSAYDHQPAGSKRFEVLLLSKDRSEAELLKYMQTEKMNWPALAYAKVESAEDLQKFHGGKGIPWLTVIDPNGQILLQSTSDKDAAEVLDRLQALAKSKT